ncbi:MAG: hypothetical protein HY332_18280, partial [Chloroflexi bacterium]|nr:hypothetical protein [Chloroflexota bacterium]
IASRALDQINVRADASQVVDQMIEKLPAGAARYRVDVTLGNEATPISQNCFEFSAR